MYFSHLPVAANGHGGARECTLPDPCEAALPSCLWLPPAAGERILGCLLSPAEIHGMVPLHSGVMSLQGWGKHLDAASGAL